MDDLTAAFSTSFQVTKEPNSTAAPHPRFSQYKMKSDGTSQEKRRRQMLELQKQKRFDMMKYVRCLAEDNWDEEDEFYEDTKEEEMEVEVKLKRPGRYYKNQLMFSEWMLEVPDDFDVSWLMVPCPVGKRCLVIAARGQTRAYAKNGHNFRTFASSILPGGAWPYGRSDSTVLDCVYDDAAQTFYVLDMMCWKTPIYDSETEFRFYWSHTKFAEAAETQVTQPSNRHNKYHFVPLPSYACDRLTIQEVMSKPLNMNLDGILFYHKQAHYTFGSTPLVVWLKAYMLPEILDVAVSSCFLTDLPSTYLGFTHHAQTVREEREKKKRRHRRQNRMVCSSNPDAGQSMSELENQSAAATAGQELQGPCV